jgi:hypothetical protein
MRVNLPATSAVRRLRPGRRRAVPANNMPTAITTLDPTRAATLADFEREVHAVREAIFELADAAHHAVPHEYTQLHVSLQIVSNELGQIERILDDVRVTAPGRVAEVS